MEESILKSVKKTLGIEADFTAFDVDILMHINSVFSVLHQIGIGPENGFAVTDDTAVWADFYAADNWYNMIRTYVYLKVRYLFDPPNTGYLVTAMKEQIEEYETRLSYLRESLLPEEEDA